MKQRGPVIYREVQRPRLIWLWMVILPVAAFFWYCFIKQVIFGLPVGNKPAPDVALVIFWIIFSIGLPAFFKKMKLVTEVRKNGLYIRYVPFYPGYREFLFKDIDQYVRVTYSPVKRFGGWGVRFNTEGETGYIVSGNEGIELLMADGNIIVLGTQNASRLMEAIESAFKRTE